MRKKFLFPIVVLGLMAALIAVTVAAAAQSKDAGTDKPANNLEIVHEKLKADKKLIVAKYMDLTEAQAKRFWPVYEEYQKDLDKLNERLAKLLESYAAEYRKNSLSDDRAQQLLDEWLALDKDEGKQRKNHAAKVLKALPAKKAARYLQIENEFRVLLKYDLAATVPLVH